MRILFSVYQTLGGYCARATTPHNGSIFLTGKSYSDLLTQVRLKLPMYFTSGTKFICRWNNPEQTEIVAFTAKNTSHN